MKRQRENNNNNNNDDIERTLVGTSTNFRISPDSTCSNTNTNNNQNQNANLPTSLHTNINNDVNSPNNTTKGSTSNSNNNTNNNKEQDRFLPIANVGRIMKKVIPGNAKISKDAKETVQECVSEFISFVTGEASDKCQREKRKTINGDDILWAIMTLGFEDYVNPLKLYLTKYRDIEGEKLNVPKQQQQRVEQRLQLEQKPDLQSQHSNNVYSSTGLIPQVPFASNDPLFPLPFSQNSMQPTNRPQQDHIDEHW